VCSLPSNVTRFAFDRLSVPAEDSYDVVEP
jgi:hypothetical protein